MQSDEKYPGLFLREWPFQIPRFDEPVNVWADRAASYQQIAGLLSYLSSVDRTSLHLMWADLGCGKTHTMAFIRHLCETQYKNVHPVYTLVPPRPAGFMDQYKSMISAFDLDQIADMIRRITAAHGEQYMVNRVLGGSVELYGVMKAIAFGLSDSRSIARRWLKGANDLSKSELRSIAAPNVVKSSHDALAILQGLCNIVIHSQPAVRLLIMIDEFQILHECSDRVSDEVGMGLHKLYEAVPRRLSILLSFAFRTKANVHAILYPALRSREDHTRQIELPAMSREEAQVYVRDLFAAYRTRAKPPSETYPLEPECLRVVIDVLVSEDRLICPRELNHCLDRLLDLSRGRSAAGVDPVMSAEDAESVLRSDTGM